MAPASTGTDGRLGRLFAVHATASASASRSTRNFIYSLRRLQSCLSHCMANLAGPCTDPGSLAFLLNPHPDDCSLDFLEDLTHRLRRCCGLCGYLTSAQVSGTLL